MCINAGMPDCLASDQSVTEMKKNHDAGTDPVPDQANEVLQFFGPVPHWNSECRNADAGVSLLDADAQQCTKATFPSIGDWQVNGTVDNVNTNSDVVKNKIRE